MVGVVEMVEGHGDDANDSVGWWFYYGGDMGDGDDGGMVMVVGGVGCGGDGSGE